jgi:hypothetical protein
MKNATLITDLFILSENPGDAPRFAAIHLDEASIVAIEKYMIAIETMKDAGLKPSVLDTHDVPSVTYIDELAVAPLSPGELENIHFINEKTETAFNEMFDEDSVDDPSVLSDIETETRLDCHKLKVRHDGMFWLDCCDKFCGYIIETEATNRELLGKIKRTIGMPYLAD